MNEYFSSIGPKLAERHTSTWMYYGKTEEATINDIQTDSEEVILLCREIEILKSSGMDDISLKICKDAFLVLSDQLAHLFNCSLVRGIFPEEWKSAKVVPLLKGGDRETVENYRPVSLLPLPGKLLEKIVHKGMTEFLEATQFLTPYTRVSQQHRQ